jgi:hypothetical protein
MKQLSTLFIVAVAAAGALAAQAPAPAAPPPTALWTLTGDFQSPESAFYDAATNAIFVSSINGAIDAKDGNGYISRISGDGKMVNAKWVTGLNGPKGLRGLGGTLWAADIDEVVAIDIASGKVLSKTPVPGATFLNDLATAPDGSVFVSDSFGSRIYVVKDGKASTFVEGAELVETANGLLVDGSRLILGTIGPAGGRGRGGPRGAAPPQGAPQAPAPAPPAPAAAPGGQPPALPSPGAGGPGAPGGGRGRGGPGGGGNLYAFDLKTKERTRLTTDPVGGIDGIEPDGRGGVLLTDVIGRRILHVSANGQTRVLAQLSGGGADFGWNLARRIAIVPYLNDHKVEAYDLTALFK